MDSPVKPANDAKGRGVTVHTASSLQRKLESRTDHPLDSSFRWNDDGRSGRLPMAVPELQPHGFAVAGEKLDAGILEGGLQRLKGGSVG